MEPVAIGFFVVRIQSDQTGRLHRRRCAAIQHQSAVRRSIYADRRFGYAIDKPKLLSANLYQVAIFQPMRFAKPEVRALEASQVLDVNAFTKLGEPHMLRSH
jgi:hypothetical protein